MNTVLIALLIISAVVVLAVAMYLGRDVVLGGARSQMHNIVSAQRHGGDDIKGKRVGRQSIFATAAESNVRKTATSRLTLRKRLKYAQWSMPSVLYYLVMGFISFVTWSIVQVKFNIVMQGFSLLTGYLFMNWLVTFRINRRFMRFDADYPSFLMSLVGLLKTGMNPMQAISTSAEQLEEGSLLKEEVRLMTERLRFGVSEDRSIGSFGEDIYHPEIELFVQALLLSRRVGGTLSDTLDRLAKQVRKRQFFRASANAAIGMQRGSIWIIVGILVALEGYMLVIYPEGVTGAWADPTGWQVWQFSILVIILGIFWVRQVTKIKI